MQFSFSYPVLNGPDSDLLDAGPVDEVARVAEDAGFMGISFTEHPVPGARWLTMGGHQSLDPFVTLAYVAAATSRIRLITHLAVAPYRNPFLLAKSAATVDKLSGGRFVLGIGTGYLKGEFRALGVDFEERNELFDEALDVLPLHWKGEPFTYRGRHFEAKEVMARPRPVQDPIPIWIGGNAKITRRRVAERAQGWMPLVGSSELLTTARTSAITGPDELATAIAEMREVASTRGVTLDVLYPYGQAGVGTTNPAADADRHREAMAELESIGVTWLTVGTGTQSFEATRDFLQAFGDTYIADRAATS
jgi:probable F420-dependent oxidoreductase